MSSCGYIERTGFFRILWDSLGFLRGFGVILGFLGILRDSWDALEANVSSYALLGFYYVL